MNEAAAELRLSETFPPPTLEAWRAVVERDLKGADFARRLIRQTLDGLELQPLYTEADLPPAAGAPGVAPFTRGARAEAGWLLEVEERPGADLAADVADGAGAVRLRPRADLDIDGLLAGGRPQVFLETGPALDATPALLGGRPGSLGLDPLGELARTGELAGALDDALALLGARAGEVGPGQSAVEVRTHVYHDAGASDAQDLGCALATGVAYLRALTAAGLSIDDAAAQLTFSLSLGGDQPLAIAKLRALRRCWSRVLDASGATPRGARIHARTAWRELTLYDPWVNLLRATVTAFSAALGGAERITPAAYDALSDAPTALGRRLVRNTHHILVGESHLDRVADPAGGAYLFERLTEDLAAAGWGELQRIEAAGGMAAALTSGQVGAWIAEVAAKRARDVARRKQPLTGVSDYPLLSEAPTRAPAAAAATDEGLPLVRERLAAPFERLRARGDASAPRPTVFVAALGSLAQHNARSTWIRNLLAAGGLAADLPEADGFADAAAAGAAFAASPAKLAVIAGADASYAEHAEATARALREAGAARVVLAGKPGDREEALRTAGVDGFVYLGQDVLAFLEQLWEVAA